MNKNIKDSKNLKRKSLIYLVALIAAVFVMVSMTKCTSNESQKTERKTNEMSNVDKEGQQDNKANKTAVVATNKVIELSDKDFDKIIKNGVVLVDFWAPWCAPCRTQGPIVDELAKEIGGKAVIAKVNVDNNNAISSKYEVRNIPTIIIFQNGKPALRFVGVQQKEFLIQQIESLL